MAEDTKDFFRALLPPQVVLHALVTLCSLVAMFTTLRADVADLTRRVVVLENEVVPRKEHEAKDRFQEEKDRLLDERLTHIEQQLDELVGRHK